MKVLILLTVLISLPVFAATKIVVGVSPALSSAGLYLAKEKGYFSKSGLDVEFVTMGNSTADMVTLLSENQIQVAAGNITAGLFNAFSKGAGFKIVADKGTLNEHAQYLWLMVKKDLVDNGTIKSLKNLKGKKIGLPSIEGSSQQIVLAKILESVGLTLSDVQLVKIGYAEMKMGLTNSIIDAAIQLEPYIFDLVTENIAVKYASAQKYLPNQQSAVLLYSAGFMKKENDTTATQFMKAYLQGVKDYNASVVDQKLWEAQVPLLNKYVKLKSGTWNKLEPVGLSELGTVDMTSLENDFKWYKANKFSRNDIQIKQLLELKYLH